MTMRHLPRTRRSGTTTWRGDRARGRFGEEGLVRHVGLGADHRDLGFAGSQLSLEAERRIHADVAAADDQDARTGRGTGAVPRELAAFTIP